VRLESKNAVYINTLGVVYYRAGRHREAAELLRANLATREDSGLCYDLYFLAMCYHRLGESARARDFYDWAVPWTRTQPGLSPGQLEELNEARAEAELLLRVEGR
jgi:uncharacterized protein HemY